MRSFGVASLLGAVQVLDIYLRRIGLPPIDRAIAAGMQLFNPVPYLRSVLIEEFGRIHRTSELLSASIRHAVSGPPRE